MWNAVASEPLALYRTIIGGGDLSETPVRLSDSSRQGRVTVTKKTREMDKDD